MTEKEKQLKRDPAKGETILQRIKGPPNKKGKQMFADKIIVTFKYKRYRRMTYLGIDDPTDKQIYRVTNELKHFKRDLTLPSIRSEFGLDEKGEKN